MKAVLLVLAALVLTVAGALVEGRYAGRWGDAPDLESAALLIESLPDEIGPWRHVGDGDRLTKSISRELGLLNHLTRVYEHEQTGRQMQLLLMVGRPGPLVRHPPTVCYANRAHKQLGDARWIPLSEDDDTKGRFQLLTYRPARAYGGEQFLVAYGHTAGDQWDTPDLPRITYGGASALYKAQVLMNLAAGEAQREDETLREITTFVRAFTVAFDQVQASGQNGEPDAG